MFNRKTKIQFVQDRPGHDLRYALDTSKIQEELGWQPSETFKSGIMKTIEWNLLNRKWSEDVLTAEDLQHESKNKLENL